MEKHKILIQGDLKLLTPLLIGSGRNDQTDCDVLVDSQGLPFIPATSFIGVLKHRTEFVRKDNRGFFARFWGENLDGDPTNQSRIICSDLLLKTSVNDLTEVRDGIRIDNETGMVDKGAKFDYQVVNTSAVFQLKIEINIPDVEKIEIFKKMAGTIIKLLTGNRLRLGAKTNLGLGRAQLNDDYSIRLLNLHNRDDFIAWLKGDSIRDDKESFADYFEIPEDNDFSIEVDLAIKNSLIIRSYSAEPKAPDSSHIKSNGENVLTGTAIKGALRARTEMILNSIYPKERNDKAKLLLADLFGYVEIESDKTAKSNRNKDGNSIPSRLFVEEVEINSVAEAVQSRICIDRFTGGAKEGALFETMALFPKNDESSANVKSFRFSLNKDYKLLSSDKGLLLLLLKDLWTSDLAIGGEKAIGRGTFKGIKAIVKDGSKEICITPGSLNTLLPMQEYIDALIDPEIDIGDIKNRISSYGVSITKILQEDKNEKN